MYLKGFCEADFLNFILKKSVSLCYKDACSNSPILMSLTVEYIF